MSATIFIHEFRARLKSVITWSLSVAALLGIYFSFFSAFADQAETINEAMKNFPPEMITAFGLDRMNLSSVLGYFSLVFLFVQLCLAIQAANYGVGLVSVEEAELTADFLMSKPVSRMQVMISKLLAAFTGLTITNAVVWMGSFLAINASRGEREYDTATLVLILASVVIFQLFFLSVGLLISLLVKRVRSVTPYGLGLGFGAYVLNAFGGLLGDVKLELITPFKHLDVAYIVQHQSFDTPLVMLNVAVTILALAVSFWLYVRRDIPAVS